MVIGTRVAQWVADLAICALVLTVFALVGVRLFGNVNTNRAQMLHPGTRMNLENINWKLKPVTIVLGLSTECPYCNASMPFYRTLTQAPAVVQLVAVFPQTIEQGTEHLKQNGVSANVVVSKALSSIGIVATPTLAIVDQNGLITDAWIGKLSTADEKAVQARVMGQNISNQSSTYVPLYIDRIGLKLLEEKGIQPTVLDLRDRPEYERGHMATALNIPIRELAVRAKIELSHEKPIVVDCHDDRRNACDLTALRLKRSGFTSVYVYN